MVYRSAELLVLIKIPMKCKITVTAKNDLPIWIKKEVFEEYVNNEDLELRASKEIYDCYHPNWFKKNQNGEICFKPPAFHFLRGEFYGINGRHRAVLLLRHLSFIPILFVNPPLNDKKLMEELVCQNIDVNKGIEIPDLPINLALLTSDDLPTKFDDEKISLSDSTNIRIEINF